MNLLPKVKNIEIKSGFLSKSYIAPYTDAMDSRIQKAIEKLPCGEDGVRLVIKTKGTNCEKYQLEIFPDEIQIVSEGLNGVFYAIQTLRQIFAQEKKVPCLTIEDEPDFEYRGLYHDVTRGKVPKAETLKKLIDDMASFKMNSLQIYVEHTFEFEETKELVKKTGCLTKEEIRELDDYCYENFIEFIPSIATFGHMYEILEQEPYRHLRVLKDYEAAPNFWISRMQHHTIDPLQEESFELVKSLIDQYEPLFRTDLFNICGDETFDLEKSCENAEEAGKRYIDFIQKIIGYMQKKNKRVMMWADILLHHPETLENLPEDIYYLNWNYSTYPLEDSVIKLSKCCKKQIVCPGTASWSRLCESVGVEETNIALMIDYGYRNGAVGVLNTNWGDYGNPASIELAMYGIILGAAKSWRVETEVGEELSAAVDRFYYGGEGIECLKKVSHAHTEIAPNWNAFCQKYYEVRYGEKPIHELVITAEQIALAQKECTEVMEKLSDQIWENEEAREEMLLGAEGVCVLAQLSGKMMGIPTETVVDPKKWMKKYREKWLKKNKESELSKIEEMILYLDAM